MSYKASDQLTNETYTAGPLSGISVISGYDSLLRRSSLSGIGILPVQYGYDPASRLQSVSDGTHSATYSYLANSSLVSNIVFATSGVTKMTTTKSWDNLNRLTSISSVPSASSVVSFSYQYNTANQRTRRTEADGSYWDYTYDALGQVTSGQKKWADGSLVSGQQFGYNFDTIGNRQSVVHNSQPEIYTANALNQYTRRTVPGTVDILGTADSNATVTVNNQPTTRHADYFHKQLSVPNSSSAAYTNISVVGVRKNAGGNSNDVVTIESGNEFLPKSPELFGYDSDGNLTNDGRWAYTWDAENRLVKAESLTSAPTASKHKVEWTYDYQGR